MSAPQPGTPLPWRTCEDPFGDQQHATGIETVTKNGLSGTPVASCDHDWEELRVSWKMATDNAAYIVHAANNFTKAQALADALRALAAAEAEYRKCHDLLGASDIKTGRAWDAMRRASQHATTALAAWDAKP